MSHWIYHPTEEAKIVDSLEFENLLKNGWYDNPGKFPVKEKEEIKVRIPPVKGIYPDEDEVEDKKINKAMLEETLVHAAKLRAKTIAS